MVDPCEQFLDIETHHEHDKDRRYQQQPIEQQIIVGAVILCEKIVQCFRAVPADERVGKIHAIGVSAALCKKFCERINVRRMLFFSAQRFEADLNMQECDGKPVCRQTDERREQGVGPIRSRIHKPIDTKARRHRKQQCGDRKRKSGTEAGVLFLLKK